MSQENRTIPVSVSQPDYGNGSENLASEHVTHEPAPEPSSPAGPAESRLVYTPLIDIYEAADGLTLEADLPGAVEGGVSIQLEDNVLSLLARVNPAAPEGARLVHEEYRAGDYYRSFILSDEVDRQRITAELRNGVLRLHLPKAERARTRRIEIRS
ncbi:MAG: Hsp20/alpha crystallin family protein [Isosphaeraceae bacterium]